MDFNPIQLNINVCYQEAKPAFELRNSIAFYWELSASEDDSKYLVIPDGCVDVIMNCDSLQPYVSPTLVRAACFELTKGESWFGIRFYPGAIANALKCNVSELEFETIDLGDINKELHLRLQRILSKADSFEQRVALANQLFIQIDRQFNPHLVQALEVIYKSKGGVLLKEGFNGSVTISNRQLRRLFNREIGVSPKTFARIVRGQFILGELKKRNFTKSYYNFYCDQPHMIKEIKELTGFTPGQIVKELFG